LSHPQCKTRRIALESPPGAWIAFTQHMSFSANLIQWPAMIASVLAAWLVASTQDRRRMWGFWIFLLSNALWIAWGIHDKAWALITLQVCLAALNVRGVKKAKDVSDSPEPA
jgi:hypothetical protein